MMNGGRTKTLRTCIAALKPRSPRWAIGENPFHEYTLVARQLQTAPIARLDRCVLNAEKSRRHEAREVSLLHVCQAFEHG